MARIIHTTSIIWSCIPAMVINITNVFSFEDPYETWDSCQCCWTDVFIVFENCSQLIEVFWFIEDHSSPSGMLFMGRYLRRLDYAQHKARVSFLLSTYFESNAVNMCNFYEIFHLFNRLPIFLFPPQGFQTKTSFGLKCSSSLLIHFSCVSIFLTLSFLETPSKFWALHITQGSNIFAVILLNVLFFFCNLLVLLSISYLLYFQNWPKYITSFFQVWFLYICLYLSLWFTDC